MLVVFPNIATDNVLVMDVEFDNMDVLQVAGMFFSRRRGDVFKLNQTFNKYVKREKVGYYATRHTGLTSEFLQENGLELNDFVQEMNNIMTEFDLNKTVFVSHGTKGDRKVLRETGLLLPAHSLCTYKLAQRTLDKDSGFRLQDVAAKSGFNANNYHDALVDVMATISSLSYLLDEQNKLKEK